MKRFMLLGGTDGQLPGVSGYQALSDVLQVLAPVMSVETCMVSERQKT